MFKEKDNGFDKIHKTTEQFTNDSVAAETNMALDVEEFDDSEFLANLPEIDDNFLEHELSNVQISEPRSKEEILQGIKDSYKNAMNCFKANNFVGAEEKLVQAIKPALSHSLRKEIIMSDCTQEVKETLLDSMYHLGQIYLANKDNKYTYNYAKAAGIFQYCVRFAEKYKDEISNWETQKDFFLYESYKIEFEFFKTIQGKGIYPDADEYLRYESQKNKVEKYQESLSQLRTHTKQKLTEEINPLGVDRIQERAAKIEDLYKEITKFFVNHELLSSSSSSSTTANQLGLIQQLLSECYAQLGAIPKGCEFAIISFGSLAGGKMTPYSDLEFGILINENNEEYKEYFRNLSKLLCDNYRIASVKI